MTSQRPSAPSLGMAGVWVPLRWPLSLTLGAAVVAVAAQFAVPLPFTPVPITLQGLAVLLVGGLMGATAGAGALALYLVLGCFGLPVFAMGTAGILKLIGPTGGYLLAFPLAAALVGRTARRGSLVRCLGGVLIGMATIHLGGLAQLVVLGIPLDRAAQLGTAPFLGVDALKVVVAALVLSRFHASLRPRA